MQEQIRYPWRPHETLHFNHYISNHDRTTREGARKYWFAKIQSTIYTYFTSELDDIGHLAVQNAVSHTTDANTLALARERIPSSLTIDNTLRFMIAYNYEKELGFQEIMARVDKELRFQNPNYVISEHNPLALVNPYIKKWVYTADKIVTLMQDDSISGNITSDPDFIRDAALIELGHKSGLQLTTAGNDVLFGLRDPDSNDPSGGVMQYGLKPNKTWYMTHFDSLRYTSRKNNATDTATLTAKNGPIEININGTKTVLAKDSSKIFTVAQLTPGPNKNISTQPVLIPTALRTLEDITDLEVAEVESHALTNLFSGIRVVTTASSSNNSVATVSVNAEGTSCGVTGVATGTATITVKGTNEAGSASVTFDVTVIPNSGD